MLSRVRVVGLGRVGGAIAARLRDNGLLATDGDADLVLICVPDSAIAEVARSLPVGPWVAHVSGAASRGSTDSGTRPTNAALARTYSAYPPLVK